MTNLSHDPILVDLVRRSSLVGFGEVRPIRGYACHLCRLPRPGIIRDNFVFCHSALLSELNEEYELCTPETCQSVIQQSKCFVPGPGGLLIGHRVISGLQIWFLHHTDTVTLSDTFSILTRPDESHTLFAEQSPGCQGLPVKDITFTLSDLI